MSSDIHSSVFIKPLQIQPFCRSRGWLIRPEHFISSQLIFLHCSFCVCTHERTVSEKELFWWQIFLHVHFSTDFAELKLGVVKSHCFLLLIKQRAIFQIQREVSLVLFLLHWIFRVYQSVSVHFSMILLRSLASPSLSACLPETGSVGERQKPLMWDENHVNFYFFLKKKSCYGLKLFEESVTSSQTFFLLIWFNYPLVYDTSLNLL